MSWATPLTPERLRVLWLAILLGVLLLGIVGVEPRFQQLRTVSAGESALTGQLGNAEVQALEDNGFTLAQFAAFFTALEFILIALFWFMGVILVWRRPSDRMAVLFAMTLATFMLAGTPFLNGLAAESAAHSSVINIFQIGVWALFLLTFLVFPNGRFVPGWARWLFGLWALYCLLTIPIPAVRFQPVLIWRNAREAALLLWAFSWLLVTVALQVYRYRYVATAVERLQTRWVVFGLSLTFGIIFAGTLPLFLMPLLGFPLSTIVLWRLVAITITLIMLLFLAVTIVVAILRFRLFDIDVIIRKTLVYGVLTGVLALVYFGLVVGLQSLAGRLTGVEESPVAIVISTLVIAALFTPLRGRVQTIIDRRFFRQKYKAEQVLAHFGRTARDETDLEVLTSELVRVVEETMRPERVGVWLREDRPERQP